MHPQLRKNLNAARIIAADAYPRALSRGAGGLLEIIVEAELDESR